MEKMSNSLNLDVERTKYPESKKGTESSAKKKHTALAQAQEDVRETYAAVFPRAEVNQTGTQRAWGSPLAPLLGDVWPYGLLHARGSTAVDLATGLL